MEVSNELNIEILMKKNILKRKSQKKKRKERWRNLTLLGTEDDGGVTGNNTYAYVSSLFPWIRTVFCFIIMEIQGHHSQRYTHFIFPKFSLQIHSNEMNDSIKSKMEEVVMWWYFSSIVFVFLIHESKCLTARKNKGGFIFFSFLLFIFSWLVVWCECDSLTLNWVINSLNCIFRILF